MLVAVPFVQVSTTSPTVATSALPATKAKEEAATICRGGRTINSLCAIRNLRERSPAIFLRPQNIKNTLYTVFRPSIPTHSTVFRTRIELSCRVIIVMKNWLICDRCASLFFLLKH